MSRRAPTGADTRPTPHRRADRTREHIEVDSHPRLAGVVQGHRDGLVGRVFRSMMAINGYDRALALSAQAFVGLIPMLVIVAALAPDSTREAGGRAMITSLGLSGDVAQATALLVREPPGADTLTVLGAVLLVLSVLGFIRALQRTYLAAWGLPSTGLRGMGHGVIGAAVLIGGFGALALLWPTLAALGGHVAAQLVVHAVAAIALWWPVQRILLGGHVSWRALLPGAVLTGVGQAVVLGVAVLFLPATIAHQAARYGLFGVAVAVVSWLLALGLLLVLSAVLGAQLAAGAAAVDAPPLGEPGVAEPTTTDG
jgi:membrane protein